MNDLEESARTAWALRTKIRAGAGTREDVEAVYRLERRAEREHKLGAGELFRLGQQLDLFPQE